MAALTIWHNPNCSTSRFAVEEADAAGVEAELRKYMLKAERPSRDEIVALLGKLEDPATDLVRRDAKFKKYGLTDDDVQTTDQIVRVILDNKMIMQRPLVVTADKAIIGRPKERIRDLLSS